MDKISQALIRLFDNHRIVFWFDEKKELREAFEALSIPEVEPLELKNNEYSIKYHILREKPNQKFLLYHEGPQPEDLDNWLLDVQLGNGLFNANQEALWANDIGLQPHLFDLIAGHLEFFKNQQLRADLKAKYKQEDTRNTVSVRMLAICARAETDNRIESVLEILLDELADERQEKISLIQRCNLDQFLWARLKSQFDYESTKPGIKDFAIFLFKKCYQLGMEEGASSNQEALIFLKRWRDNIHHQTAFNKLAVEYQEVLGIERDLEKREFRKLVEIDFFEVIDKKILSELAHQLLSRTISAGDCANMIWRRRTTHWYGEFEHIYQALYFASQFINELGKADLRVESMADGIRKYQNTWYRLDQYYRKFIFHTRADRKPVLDKLVDQMENLYSNNYLLPLNDNWQHVVDGLEVWSAAPVLSQKDFYATQIKEYLGSRNKIAVIISDALRYEIGEELVRVIQEEDRYTAELEPMLSVLPSYTQLGMAGLLPHNRLTIVKDGNVLLDDQSTVGTENRAKILAKETQNEATAITSLDYLAMSRDESRELTKTNRILYIYHNQIDAMGDAAKTEGRVFEAVDSALQEIMDIIKKLAGANYSNVIVTSDHGFIYQNHQLDQSDFAVDDPQGSSITYYSRRFVIGESFVGSKSYKEFSASALGLGGDYRVAIPKSINRLRQQGSGSRYVHGGAALQEVIIPLVKVNKKRSADIVPVDVEVINSTTAITTGQITVAFYQVEPVAGKISPRTLRAGIFSRDNTQLSDLHLLNFDLTSENPREREVKKQFTLSRKADEMNNQTVFLRLEELEPETTHYKQPPYKEISYQLRRSFTSDFE